MILKQSSSRIIGYKVLYQDGTDKKGIINLDLAILLGTFPEGTTEKDCAKKVWDKCIQNGYSPVRLEYWVTGHPISEIFVYTGEE